MGDHDDHDTPDGRDDAPVVTPDPWRDWRRATPARLALGRVGTGMPTDETLRFGWAHAMARDAIGVGFSLFEFTSLGVICMVVGCIYMLTIGRWLLPETRSTEMV